MKQDMLVFITYGLLVWIIMGQIYTFMQLGKVISLLYSIVMGLLLFMVLQDLYFARFVVILPVIIIGQMLLKSATDPAHTAYVFSRDVLLFRVAHPRKEDALPDNEIGVFVPTYHPQKQRSFIVLSIFFIWLVLTSGFFALSVMY